MSVRSRLFRILAGGVSAAVMLCASVLSPYCALPSSAVVKEIVGIGGEYTDNVTVAKRLDVVFSEFPVGSYFSYTGKPCTCHNKCSYVGGCDCISDYNDPEKNGKLVRLYSCQCMGFAHYMFYKLFGFVDRAQNYPETEELYYSVGSLSPSQMTVENVKKLFKDVKTGANVRAGDKHSFIVLSTDEEGLNIYHANTGSPCRVDGWYWTWEELTATYKSVGIRYIHLPVNYPESTGEYVPPVVTGPTLTVTDQPGAYRVDASVGLRLRKTPSTSGEILEVLPHKTLLEVSEISEDWGKVTYNEKTGWVSMDYLLPVLQVQMPADRFYVYEGAEPDMTGITVSQLLEDLSVKRLTEEEYTVSYSASDSSYYTVTVKTEELLLTFPIEVLAKGDVNGDGKWSVADVMLLLRGEQSLSESRKRGADVNGDGKIDGNDALEIMNYLIGKGAKE